MFLVENEHSVVDAFGGWMAAAVANSAALSVRS
jgi:hypothetical protein